MEKTTTLDELAEGGGTDNTSGGPKTGGLPGSGGGTDNTSGGPKTGGLPGSGGGTDNTSGGPKTGGLPGQGSRGAPTTASHPETAA